MSSKGFLAIIGVIIAVGLGVIIFAGQKDNTTPVDSQSLAKVQVDDHVTGKADSEVVFIEYGDMECPFCAQYDPLVVALEQEYGDRVAFVFRHFPIPTAHPRAIQAARAVEAAGRQNAFFEMLHFLYSEQSSWDTKSNPDIDAKAAFEAYATEMGLNIDQFRSDVADSSLLEFINSQSSQSSAFSVESTPTFILNGKKLEKVASYQDFKDALDAALASAEASQTTDTTQ